MKKRKPDFEIITLIFAAISLVFSIIMVLNNKFVFRDQNELLLSAVVAIAGLVFVEYALIIYKKSNPKKYIYISYSENNREVAELVEDLLSRQLKRYSKYRFEFLSSDSISYGDNIKETTLENIKKSDFVLILVSSSYLSSDYCTSEFMMVYDLGKKIIPIVLDSVTNLSRLPKDISNIKALILSDYNSASDFEKQLLLLAKDFARVKNK